AGPQEIEEERRLAYVAITRAKRRLTVTKASTRMLYGSTGRNIPSRFLREIPEEFCSFSEAAPAYSYLSGGIGKRSFSSYAGDDFDDDFTPVTVSREPRRQFITPREQSAPAQSFSPGQTVEHKTFGKGMVLSSKPMGSDTLLEIAFETVGTKKLMANFAKLKKV
ncbi:MAG: ATP-dependent DNA helicase PcrA, partial [Clostridia bacterium]|nr:ATP-dependent DNA helicase PcrA [Clostridia bacterium]